MAWSVGLVVPGAPGGLGVFELVLLARLAGAVPEAEVLAVLVSYRLISVAAELLAAGGVELDRLLLPGSGAGVSPLASTQYVPLQKMQHRQLSFLSFMALRSLWFAKNVGVALSPQVARPFSLRGILICSALRRVVSFPAR